MQRYKEFPEWDILIWATALVRYKFFGYTLKLYCLESDFEFLKKWHLYDLYDIIDTELLKDNEQLNKIDNKRFWSSRKIEAMYHELFDLNEEAIYVDIDILMRQPFDISNCDALLWSPEPRNIVKDQYGNTDWTQTIYLPWRYISKPNNYKMPEYILNTADAYNCGVWYFKNKEVFKEYRKQYYDFAINNPCEIKHMDQSIVNNEVFACNCEQRIIKAVLTYYHQNVKTVMPHKATGLCNEGYHFFWYRANWRLGNKNPSVLAPEALQILNGAVMDCVMTLKTCRPDLYQFFFSSEYLKNFETRYTLDPKHQPLKKYQ